MKKKILIELELIYQESDFLDKVTDRIYKMDCVQKTGIEAKFIDSETTEGEAIADEVHALRCKGGL